MRRVDGVDLCELCAPEPRTSVARAKPDPILGGGSQRKDVSMMNEQNFVFGFQLSLTEELPLHHIINQA